MMDFLSRDEVFFPLLIVAVLLIVVFVVMRMRGNRDDD